MLLSWLRHRLPTPKPKRTTARRRALGLEALEDRAVPASLTLSGGVLTFTAGAGVANDVQVYSTPSGVLIVDPSETIDSASPLVSGNHSHLVSIPAGAVQSIVLHLGDGNDQANIHSAVVPVTVTGDQGNDVITVGDSWFGVDNVLSLVTVVGGADSDRLVVDDAAGTQTSFYGMTSSTIFHHNLNPQQIAFGGIEHVELITGQSAIGVHVISTAQGVTTDVDLTHTPNPVFVGVYNNNDSLADIHGPISIETNASIAALSTIDFSDYGETAGHHYTFDGISNPAKNFTPYERIMRDGVVLATITGPSNTEVDGGSGNDLFTVNGTRPVFHLTAYGDAGNDTMVVGTTNGLDTVLAPVTFYGGASTGPVGDKLVISDINAAASHTYLLVPDPAAPVTGGQFLRDGQVVVTFGGVDTLDTETTKFNNLFIASVARSEPEYPWWPKTSERDAPGRGDTASLRGAWMDQFWIAYANEVLRGGQGELIGLL
jgi:hypothetical protein